MGLAVFGYAEICLGCDALKGEIFLFEFATWKIGKYGENCTSLQWK